MGMIANYQILSEEELNKIKEIEENQEELFEYIEKLNEEVDLLLDIDKMWDTLHFVLTGKDSSEPVEGDALSEAVIGEIVLATEDFISYTTKERIKYIVDALEKFDMKEAMKHFDMKECKKANLYPNIWDDEDEKEEIVEEIMDYFEMMKNFYKKILDNNANVLVTIY